jgi:DNA helicase IV
LKLIDKIPNFKVNLTEEQAKVISHNGDALVIGRSGTGKTTCALLRLFSTDILFKLRVKLD